MTEGESDQIKEDPEVPMAPVYHPKVKIAMKPQGHQYHLCSKRASEDTCTKGISYKESGCKAWSNYSCSRAAGMFKALILILQTSQSQDLWTHSGLGYSSWLL